MNFEFDPKVREQMEMLQERTGAASVNEVIRHALSLYDIATKHADEGGDILFRDKEGKQSVSVKFL